MLKSIFTFILLTSFLTAHCMFSDSTFHELDIQLEKRSEYILLKQSAIRKLQASVPEAITNNNTTLLYFLYSELANEYDAFNYDSAMTYAIKRINLAYTIKDPAKIAYSKSETAEILLKRGLYRESIDTLLSVDASILAMDKRIMHYGNLARAYYDIADYNKDYHYSPNYRKIAEQYVDSVLTTSEEENFYTAWFYGLRYLARYDLDKAVIIYEDALTMPKLTEHQKAQIHSALGYIYREYKQPDKAVHHISLAAIGDIKTAMRESMALTSLAGFLYEKGDIDRAYRYVLIAKEDADAFGAKLRQLSIGYLLPKIEAAQLQLTEKKRKQLRQSNTIIAIVLFLIGGLGILSLIQIRKLRAARKQVLNSNTELHLLTDKLREANKIKTEYIGYYFNFSTKYIDKLDSLKKIIASFLANKNYEGIDRTIKNLNPKSEREQLFKNFDNYFLIIFPEFVTRFNLLLKPEAAIETHPGELNTDLRIFALIRLGVKDNESIAKILGFSVNTIYTYKTKIKKQALVSAAEFDERIMDIKAV